MARPGETIYIPVFPVPADLRVFKELPKLPYLVGQGGKTVSEELAATQHLALLPMGVKGEIVHEG